MVRDSRPLEVHLGKAHRTKRSQKVPLDEVMRSTITGENAFAEVRRSINYNPPRQGTSMSRVSVDGIDYNRGGGSRLSNDPLDDPFGSVDNPIESIDPHIHIEQQRSPLNMTTIKERKPKRKGLSPIPPHTAKDTTAGRSPALRGKPSPSPTRSPREARAYLEKLYKSVEVETTMSREETSSLS